MSESGSERAVVPSNGKAYQNPGFGNRKEHMEKQLNDLLKSTKLDVKNYVDKETHKSINRIKSNIHDGKKSVTDDQKDFGNINLRIKAVNKKFELERKIKHMGINECLLRKGEMEEKLDLLNKNINILATNEDKDEESKEDVAEGEGDDNQLNNHKSGNRRSMDAIHQLEDKLGLPIAARNARIMNYKDKMSMTKEEFIKSQESAEQFVNKMKEHQSQRKNKRKEILEKEQNKTKTILDKNSEKKREYEEKKKERLMKRIDKHKEMMEKNKADKEQHESNWKAFKKTEKKGMRLHEEIEDRYNKQILMPELEKKKKDLENIRQFYKPIKREELDEHEKEYQENINIENEKQRMRREKWYSDIGYGVYDENKYKTKFYEKAIVEEKKKEVKKRVASQNKKRKQEKMNNYAKIVKEMHWPQVSEKKKQEIEQLKYQAEHSHKPKFRSPEIRSRYNDSDDSQERRDSVKKPDWKKFHNNMIPQPEHKKQPVHVDWLADRRKKRQDDDSTHLNQSQAWRSIADNKDLDDNAKAQLLKTKARLLEENAQRKEQMNKIAGATMEGTVEVNEMLIDAIESKLSLLDNYI